MQPDSADDRNETGDAGVCSLKPASRVALMLKQSELADAAVEEILLPEPIEVIARQASAEVKPFVGARWDWASYDYRRSVDSLWRTHRSDNRESEAKLS